MEVVEVGDEASKTEARHRLIKLLGRILPEIVDLADDDTAEQEGEPC